MSRPRSAPGRRAITQAEEIELRLGPPHDQPSLFADARDRAAGEAALAAADAARGDGYIHSAILAPWIAGELWRREAAHRGCDHEIGCPTCNPGGWRYPQDARNARIADTPSLTRAARRP